MPAQETFDFVVIGSGFGGSVSAMRLTEKGYRVLVLERGKRYRDQDFAKRNWNIFKYLWWPALRCFGILQLTPFRDVFVLHGAGVGGGSLGYANVLMEPSDKLFEAPAWRHLADWKAILRPHYDTARRMLGVTRNPCLWPADHTMREIAAELRLEGTFQPTDVGVFFGEPGQPAPDPYFGGEGPARTGCIQCGGCMVGCRHGAKNTLVKNYLYFAEKWGAQVWPECEVREVRALPPNQPDGARYAVVYRSSTAWLFKPERSVRARNVVFAGGALGTLRLLFRCRDVTRSLPNLSAHLGDLVRTNSEALLGSINRDRKTNYSEGIAITSIFHADGVTTIEPVRYPAGSSLMRFLGGPLMRSGGIATRIGKLIAHFVRRPLDFLRTHVLPGWARRTTIILVMQTEDNRLRLRLGRSLFTLFRRNLVSKPDSRYRLPIHISIGHQVTQAFAQKTNGIPMGSLNESLLNIPITAHILGGCPFGRDAQAGVVDLDCQVHNYPGLYVVDGSIVPANPGVNPSLTITALAEYALSRLPPKDGYTPRPAPLGVQRASDALII
ncbi:MAG TPA: GMC family oxidoreductase [Anaerolineae bacterium]|nr:GMC family oxidoreductase [Anaerolineae bacterium]